MKRHVLMMVVLALCLAGTAEAGEKRKFQPLQVYVDINGAQAKIPITAKEDQPGIVHAQEVAMYRRQVEPMKGRARVFQPVELSDKWTEARFTFVPGASGKVMIKLGAKWFDPKDEKRLVYFDDINVSGVKLANPGFEKREDGNIAGWKLSGKTKSLAPANGGHKGGKCARLSLYDFAFLYQNIEVKATQPITVTFWYRVTPAQD